MRIPTLKVYRAFSAFDDVPDEECERYVRRVRANCTNAEALAPAIISALACVAWALGWPFAVWNFNADRYVPLPATFGGRVILLIVSAFIVTALTGLLVRDVGLYFGLRKELERTNCRKCGFSLRGVPLTTVGLEQDPARTFVRCPECGRKYCLLDVGLSARDLAPWASKEDYERAGKQKQSARGGY